MSLHLQFLATAYVSAKPDGSGFSLGVVWTGLLARRSYPNQGSDQGPVPFITLGSDVCHFPLRLWGLSLCRFTQIVALLPYIISAWRQWSSSKAVQMDGCHVRSECV